MTTPSNRFALVPASYLYLIMHGQVLLQLRQNTGYMDGHWVAGAAGHVELHESAAQCAVREAAEEIGIAVELRDLEPLTVMQRTDGTPDPVGQRVDWFFAARCWAGEPTIMEPAKCARLEWHDLDRLPSPMPAYEREVLLDLRAGTLPPFMDYGFTDAG